jgi:hypothetical protein
MRKGWLTSTSEANTSLCRAVISLSTLNRLIEEAPRVVGIGVDADATAVGVADKALVGTGK